MSKLIIAYGPSGSGKTTAAQEWLALAPSKRVVVDEGQLDAKFLNGVVNPHLLHGRDVWMNVLTDAEELPRIAGLPIELRKFEQHYESGDSTK